MYMYMYTQAFFSISLSTLESEAPEVTVVSENISTGSGFPPGAHPQIPESTLVDALKRPSNE